MKKMNSISRPLLALALALPGASCLVEYIVTKKGLRQSRHLNAPLIKDLIHTQKIINAGDVLFIE